MLLEIASVEKWTKEMKDMTIIFLYLVGGVLVLSGVASLMGKLIEHFLV